MGQKQLLLIVLGLIIVGAAIVVGVNLFRANAANNNRESLTVELNNIAGFAVQYYSKTKEQGGGDKSFIGFEIPQSLQKTENGKYTIVYTHPERILFEGVGTEKVGEDFVTVQVLVRPEEIKTHIVY